MADLLKSRAVLGEWSAVSVGDEPATGTHRAEPSCIACSRTEIELVHIPGGTFLMGTPLLEILDDRDDEHPQHEVTVSPFYLAKHPVTNQQYARYLRVNPAAPKPKHWGAPGLDHPMQPVVGVSWEEASAFAEWCGLSLPTEAQWEYACRAGTRGNYWSGDEDTDLDRVGWYYGNAGGSLHPVAEKPANPFGLHDMHGNVWEWCSDWYGIYGPAAEVDPLGPMKGPGRVIRGGAWSFLPELCRSAYRRFWRPTSRIGFLGFRLVANEPPRS